MPSPAHPGAARFLPPDRDVPSLRAAAEGCRGCDLWRDATQTVFGAGPDDAGVLLLGEQPGDREDRLGQPFVGPAGHLLDQALKSAGIAPGVVYRTNAVKHFKWEERGGRRIHKKPSRTEVVACQPWFRAELTAIAPRVLVLLGATAAQSVLGPGFRVTTGRGRVPDGPEGMTTIATVHPSSILRAPGDRREEELEAFVEDLRLVAGALAG